MGQIKLLKENLFPYGPFFCLLPCLFFQAWQYSYGILRRNVLLVYWYGCLQLAWDVKTRRHIHTLIHTYMLLQYMYKYRRWRRRGKLNRKSMVETLHYRYKYSPSLLHDHHHRCHYHLMSIFPWVVVWQELVDQKTAPDSSYLFWYGFYGCMLFLMPTTLHRAFYVVPTSVLAGVHHAWHWPECSLLGASICAFYIMLVWMLFMWCRHWCSFCGTDMGAYNVVLALLLMMWHQHECFLCDPGMGAFYMAPLPAGSPSGLQNKGVSAERSDHVLCVRLEYDRGTWITVLLQKRYLAIPVRQRSRFGEWEREPIIFIYVLPACAGLF